MAGPDLSPCTAGASDQSSTIGTGSPRTADARPDDASRSGRDHEDDVQQEPGPQDQGSSSDDEPVGCFLPAHVRLTSSFSAFSFPMPVVLLLSTVVCSHHRNQMTKA